jgi:hypothetical protein
MEQMHSILPKRISERKKGFFVRKVRYIKGKLQAPDK